MRDAELGPRLGRHVARDVFREGDHHFVLGGERVESRLATIWKGEAMQQSRLPLWTDSWPLVLEFPLLGTGYGTFSYVEPLHRAHTPSNYVHEHAHNEYLEALIEGGVVRLAISLLAIGLMFRLGYRAVRRLEGTPAGDLAVGALFGFTTLAVHSIGDFGLHLPAIALLATVLCAQLAALGSEEAATNAFVFRWAGLAPVAGAITTLALGLVLSVEGWRLARVQTYRLTAASLQGKTDPADRDRQMALREAAARETPESGRVLSELAQAHLDRFEERQAQLTRDREAVVAAFDARAHARSIQREIERAAGRTRTTRAAMQP